MRMNFKSLFNISPIHTLFVLDTLPPVDIFVSLMERHSLDFYVVTCTIIILQMRTHHDRIPFVVVV